MSATAHKPSVLPYFVVFFLLMALTALTVWTSFMDLSSANTPLALMIAVIKAALVILFFMHAIHSSPLTWLVIVASIFFVCALLGLTMIDYLTRTWTFS